MHCTGEIITGGDGGIQRILVGKDSTHYIGEYQKANSTFVTSIRDIIDRRRVLATYPTSV